MQQTGSGRACRTQQRSLACFADDTHANATSALAARAAATGRQRGARVIRRATISYISPLVASRHWPPSGNRKGNRSRRAVFPLWKRAFVCRWRRADGRCAWSAAGKPLLTAQFAPAEPGRRSMLSAGGRLAAVAISKASRGVSDHEIRSRLRSCPRPQPRSLTPRFQGFHRLRLGVQTAPHDGQILMAFRRHTGAVSGALPTLVS